jgi:hypothetical protein
MHRRPPLLKLLLVLSAAFIPCCAPSVEDVETRLEKDLARVLGPSLRYDVLLEGSDIPAGRAGRVSAIGRRVRPEKGPVLDSVDATFSGVHYDRKTRRLVEVDSAHIAARILATDLAAFLNDNRHLQSVSARFLPPDSLEVNGRPEIESADLLRGLDFSVAGRVVPAGSRLNLELSRTTVVGFPLSDIVNQAITRLINPVVDLSQLPIALTVTGVRVQDDQLFLEARGSLTAPPDSVL